LITPVVLNITNQKQVKINKKKRGRSIKPTPNRRNIMLEIIFKIKLHEKPLKIKKNNRLKKVKILLTKD
jgi:hypothetical protein